MKILQLGIFWFCIVFQIFLWLVPDTDFKNGIFYVQDVGGIGRKTFWEVPSYLYLLWFAMLFALPRKKCFTLILLYFIGGFSTENLYLYNLHINAEEYPLQELPGHLINSFYWYFLATDVYLGRILNSVIIITLFSFIYLFIIIGIKKGCMFLLKIIKIVWDKSVQFIKKSITKK